MNHRYFLVPKNAGALLSRAGYGSSCIDGRQSSIHKAPTDNGIEAANQHQEFLPIRFAIIAAVNADKNIREKSIIVYIDSKVITSILCRFRFCQFQTARWLFAK